MKRILTSTATGLFLLANASSVWACPLCKFALETDEAQPKAYMVSILFMMGMISILFTSVGGLLWWVAKQEKMALTAAGYQHLFDNGVNQHATAKVVAEA